MLADEAIQFGFCQPIYEGEASKALRQGKSITSLLLRILVTLLLTSQTIPFPYFILGFDWRGIYKQNQDLKVILKNGSFHRYRYRWRRVRIFAYLLQVRKILPMSRRGAERSQSWNWMTLMGVVNVF
jgi:hypothetical protein